MEEQESEAQKHQRGRLGASKNTEGQAKRKDTQQVGRPIYHHIYGKFGGLQAPHARRHRRPLFMEQGHATEVLCVGNVYEPPEENNRRGL